MPTVFKIYRFCYVVCLPQGLLYLVCAVYAVVGKGRCCELKGTHSLSILSLLTLGNLHNVCMPLYFFLSLSFSRFHLLVRESSPQTALIYDYLLFLEIPLMRTLVVRRLRDVVYAASLHTTLEPFFTTPTAQRACVDGQCAYERTHSV